jgi:hypothetical protein
MLDHGQAVSGFSFGMVFGLLVLIRHRHRSKRVITVKLLELSVLRGDITNPLTNDRIHLMHLEYCSNLGHDALQLYSLCRGKNDK